MSDLISREALIKVIWSKYNDFYNDASRFDEFETKMAKRVLSDVQVIVESMPAFDAVSVVRCKDCKHYNKKIGWCDYHSHFIDSDGNACHPWESSDWKIFTDDDFCSDGERKGGAE